MKKLFKLCVWILSFVLVVSNIPITAYAATYTHPSQVTGSTFTSRPKMARMLDIIFNGNAGIYSNSKCTKLVNTKLGTQSVPNNGLKRYVGAYNANAKNSGTSCWIYANGVYYTLFNEALGSGTAGKNSIRLNISKTPNRKLTYENLCEWGVHRHVGAQVRVGNHSIIILGYNDTGLKYLDGNGDGKGLVAVRDLTWKQVKNTNAINGTVQYVIQPKEDYLNKLYPCSHRYSSFNLCTDCGAVKANTISSGYIGEGVVAVSNATGCHIRKAPYQSCGGAGFSKFLSNGTKFAVVGLIKNSKGNYWYKIRLKDGSFWYVYRERIRVNHAAKYC